jgi:hypothetical protein
MGGTTGGSAGRGGRGGRGGSDAGGSGARSGSGGRGGANGQGGDAAEAGTSDAGGSDSGGSSNTGGNGGVAGTGATGGDGPSGGVSGDGGAPAGAGGDGGTGGVPTTAVTLTVNTGVDTHAISPWIYGVNPRAVGCDDPAARFTLCRLGGNRWSTYNWETNASNAGSELCFQNDGALGASDTPGDAVTSMIEEASGQGAATLVTIPLLDYVAADKLGGSGAPECSGDVRDTPSYLSARFDQNVAVKGSAFVTSPDTGDDYVYQDEFVSFLKDEAPPTAPVLFALDNQPGLWHLTHEPVHPDHASYDEVVNRNVAFARAIREQWPEAAITGYVGYGWADFTSLQNSDDGLTKGTFIDYYLDGLEAASNSDGGPLLDYLDVHWYSEIYAGSERIIYNGSTPELVQARVQAPRSFWDPTYIEDSWIGGGLGHAIELLPWLGERLALHYADYPATQLAISEWSFGGGTHISGAIAAADTLGIFGREGVGLAAWVSLTNDDPFVVGAFQMFRNYDGAGAAFGDTSVSAASSDIAAASVYASTDTLAAGRVVIVAINRAPNLITATLNVIDAQTFTTADVYALTSASASPSAASPLTAGAGNTFSYDMPAYSVSVIVPKP